MDGKIAESPEDSELQDILKKVASYPKLTLWIILFLDRTNKETWGNRTASALIAYHLDRNEPKQYAVAMSIGYQNFRKLQNLAADYIERAGMTIGRQLDLLAAKAVESNNSKFLQMLMEITGVYQSKPSIAIQNNTQINNANIQITPEEEAKLDREFAEFIDYKYRKPALDPVVTSNNTPD